MSEVFQALGRGGACLLLVSVLNFGCNNRGDDGPAIIAGNSQERPVDGYLDLVVADFDSPVVGGMHEDSPTVESLRGIAAEHLQLGMDFSEATGLLARYNLSPMGLFASGGSMTAGFRTSDIDGPQLVVYSTDVTMDGDGRIIGRVRGWEVHEAPSRDSKAGEPDRE